MTYLPEESRVVYQPKDGKQGKVFNVLEWIAAMCSHIPDKGEQMAYSIVSRGKRKMMIRISLYLRFWNRMPPPRNTKNWAQLMQNIWSRSLTCSKWSSQMRVISVIEDDKVIKKIVKHLGLWEVKKRLPPKTKVPPLTIHTDHSDSQVPLCEHYLYCDPYYPIHRRKGRPLVNHFTV